MATTVLEQPSTAPAYAPEAYRLSVAQYRRMIACGVLSDLERVELIDGLLVSRMPTNPPHSDAVQQLGRAFNRGLPDGWASRCQDSITLATSQPVPDVVVVLDVRYRDRHPGPADIALVVEVSDSSLAYDRGEKARLYATAGLPLYWVVNLIDGQVEVYTAPGPGGYADRRDYLPGAVLALPLGALAMGVEVAECLPAAV